MKPRVMRNQTFSLKMSLTMLRKVWVMSSSISTKMANSETQMANWKPLVGKTKMLSAVISYSQYMLRK